MDQPTHPLPIAIAGLGKIARDQHLPAIAASPAFVLAARLSRRPTTGEVPAVDGIASLRRAMPEVAAVAICTPPRGRLPLIAEALSAGLHVLVEKPPAATIGEAERIAALPRHGATLFQSWHVRFAPGVAAARAWLAHRAIRQVMVRWQEDVRVWHPGQEWIWEPGI